MTIIHHPAVVGLQKDVPGDLADWLAMGWVLPATAAPDPSPDAPPTPLGSAVIKHKAVGE